jgi:hypothetical protein
VKEWRTFKYAAMPMGCSGGFLKGAPALAQAHNRDTKTLCDYETCHGCGEEDIRWPVLSQTRLAVPPRSLQRSLWSNGNENEMGMRMKMIMGIKKKKMKMVMAMEMV